MVIEYAAIYNIYCRIEFAEVRIERFLNIQIVVLTTPYTRVITDQNNTRTVSGTDHGQLLVGILADKFSY
jgi:hypothetical protein